jgi:hypothetical protein
MFVPDRDDAIDDRRGDANPSPPRRRRVQRWFVWLLPEDRAAGTTGDDGVQTAARADPT